MAVGVLVLVVLPTVRTAPHRAVAAPVTLTFSTPGTSTWTVPPGLSQATFDLYGAAGGTVGFGQQSSSGGRGGRATVALPVTPGQTATAPVTVVFACTDAVSGPVSPTVSTTLSKIGNGQTASGTCTDTAGNTSQTRVGNINIASPTPPPGGLSATITGCVAQAVGIYSCSLRVTLMGGAAVNTVLRALISGASYYNPTTVDMPTVSDASGCANSPNPSPYLRHLPFVV